MNRTRLAGIMLAAALGCTPGPKSGGGCTYDDTPGTCTLTRVGNLADYNNDPTSETTFDFVKNGETAVSDHGTLTIGSGDNPGRTCLDAEGYTLGSSHACTRQVENKGTCSPKVWVFPDFDQSRCY